MGDEILRDKKILYAASLQALKCLEGIVAEHPQYSEYVFGYSTISATIEKLKKSLGRK